MFNYFFYQSIYLFFQEIRNFKFPPSSQNSPNKHREKEALFKKTSNPLLTSEHLHRELDRMRERMQDEETDRESVCNSSQWSLI